MTSEPFTLADRTMLAHELIDRARHDGVTGRLRIRLADRDHSVFVYLHHGHVYSAERSTDPGLGVQLLVSGIVTRRQLRAGALDPQGIDRLGSLFDLDPTIDRTAVETYLGDITAELLADLTDRLVESSEFDHAHGHPNDVDQWFGVAEPVVVPVEFASSLMPELPVVPAGHIVLDDLAATLITDSVLAAIDRALTTQGHHAAALIAA